MYEKTSGVAILGIALIGSVTGQIPHLFREHSLENEADSRVAQIQAYNQELQQDLMEVSPGVIGKLVLNDGDHSYTFQTQTTNGQAETCSGSYEVKDEIAIAVGELACTQTSPIGK